MVSEAEERKRGGVGEQYTYRSAELLCFILLNINQLAFSKIDLKRRKNLMMLLKCQIN